MPSQKGQPSYMHHQGKQEAHGMWHPVADGSCIEVDGLLLGNLVVVRMVAWYLAARPASRRHSYYIFGGRVQLHKVSFPLTWAAWYTIWLLKKVTPKV